MSNPLSTFPNEAASATGGMLLVNALRDHGVRHVFCVPGESFLAVLDAFCDVPSIRVISNRQEGGACYMAEAYAKATREVGVCFVTRGPGAMNASIGVLCAAKDSTPLVLFVGQVPRAHRGRDAFQEVDYPSLFGSIAKWVVEAPTAERLPALTAQAFHIARHGRPGPVVISLPEDVLSECAAPAPASPIPLARPQIAAEQLHALANMLDSAERPLFVVGGGVQYARARNALILAAERFATPVLTAFRRNDAFPNTHPLYAGNLGLGAAAIHSYAQQADLLVFIGARLSEITSGRFRLPTPAQKFFRVDTDAEGAAGGGTPPALAIVADARLTLEALNALPDSPTAASRKASRQPWIDAGRSVYRSWSEAPVRPGANVSMEHAVRVMQEVLPADAVITVDAGNASSWIQRYFRWQAEDTLLGPIVGSMGYGVPAAIAAKLAHPQRVVVGTSGDGGFLMNGQELATAVQYALPIVHLVFDNGGLGTIRMHQEQTYPGRVSATMLRSPDFCALAQAYGAAGFRVEHDAEFRPALEAAVRETCPVLLAVRTSMQHISPEMTLHS